MSLSSDVLSITIILAAASVTLILMVMVILKNRRKEQYHGTDDIPVRRGPACKYCKSTNTEPAVMTSIDETGKTQNQEGQRLYRYHCLSCGKEFFI